MANETVFTSASAQARKIWSTMLTREAIGRTWMSRFMGTSPNSLVQLHQDTRRERGDTIKFDLLMQLQTYGVSGEAALRDNEEVMVYHQDEVVIDQNRNGIAYRSMSQQRTVHQMRMNGMDIIADYFARMMDEVMLASAAGTAAGNAALNTFMTTGFEGAEITALDANHILDKTTGTFTVDYLTAAREMAKVGPGGDPIIRPFRTQAGEDVYAAVLHPYQITSMKTEAGSSKWREIVQNAQVRGGSNPIFTGAVGMWDGVVIHESNYVPRGASSEYTLVGEGADTNYGVLLGAQALHLAFGQPYRQLGRTQDVGQSREFFTFMEDVTDYGDRTGVAGASIFGIKRAVFNSATYASILIATNDAASGP